MKMRFSILIAAFVLIQHSVSWADLSNPPNWCRGIEKFKDSSTMAEITVPEGTKVHFLSDLGNCPSRNEPKCINKAYLISGDRILVGAKYKDWTCSVFQPKKGDPIEAWLLTSSIKSLPNDNVPSVAKWVGTWKSANRPDASWFGIKVQGSQLSVGGAFIPGSGMADATFDPTLGTPKGSSLKISLSECAFTFNLVGSFLIVNQVDPVCLGTVMASGIYSCSEK